MFVSEQVGCLILIYAVLQRMNIGLRAFFVIAESLQRKASCSQYLL